MTDIEMLVLAYFADDMTDEQARAYNELHAEDIEEAIHCLIAEGRINRDFEVIA